MPIVINELVIRATVGESGDGRPGAPAPRQAPPVDRKALVEACVEEVLRLLKEKKER